MPVTDNMEYEVICYDTVLQFLTRLGLYHLWGMKVTVKSSFSTLWKHIERIDVLLCSRLTSESGQPRPLYLQVRTRYQLSRGLGGFQSRYGPSGEQEF